MPDINMQVFEEVKRNQLVTEVDIQTQVALDDYQVQLSDIVNPTQSQDNVVIDRFGEFLPHWNESLDFDTWVKMSMEVAGKRLLMLRGNVIMSSASNERIFPLNEFFEYSQINNIIVNSDKYTHGNSSVICDNGDILVVHQYSDTHAAGVGTIESHRSTDNGMTWTSSATVYDETGTYDALNPGIGIAPNGDLVVIVNVRVTGAGAFPGLRFVISDDNGATWGSPAWVESTPSDINYISSNIITIGSNMYTALYKGNTDGSGPWNHYLYKSTNNGVSWTQISQMYTQSDLAEDPIYSTLTEMTNGDLLWMTFQDTAEKNYYRISDDNGATWGTLTQSTLSGSAIQDPDIILVGSTYFLHGRDCDTEDFGVYSSTNGTSWTNYTLIEIMTTHSAYSSAVSIGNNLHLIYSSDEDNVKVDLRQIIIPNSDLSFILTDIWTLETGVVFNQSSTQRRHGTYSGHRHSNNGGGEGVYRALDQTYTSDIIIDFSVYVETTDATNVINLEHTTNNYLNGYAIYFSNDGNIKYYDGSYHVLQAYSADTWYNISVTTNFAGDTFDITINGTTYTNCGSRGTVTQLAGIELTGWDANSDYYIDSIRSRKYTAVEPTWLADGEEQNIAVALKSLGRVG